ncbi:hypothetical protein C8R46DRAFT_1188840 [Mycena filopes]|nr:hypothetical protein C8R46DRAFT_1188840 [Mycena filopes]
MRVAGTTWLLLLSSYHPCKRVEELLVVRTEPAKHALVLVLVVLVLVSMHGAGANFERRQYAGAAAAVGPEAVGSSGTEAVGEGAQTTQGSRVPVAALEEDEVDFSEI